MGICLRNRVPSLVVDLPRFLYFMRIVLSNLSIVPEVGPFRGKEIFLVRLLPQVKLPAHRAGHLKIILVASDTSHVYDGN